MNSAIWIAAITGGIGSGKSTAVSFFREQGIEVVDADAIARDLLNAGQQAYHETLAHFGSAILMPDQSINRTSLRTLILSHPEERLWLESLLHPLIRKEIKKRIETIMSPYGLADIPLLKRREDFAYIKRVLVIDCPIELQMTRIQERDKISPQEARQIIQTQISREARLALADDIIYNDKDIKHFYQALQNVHKHYLALAAK